MLQARRSHGKIERLLLFGVCVQAVEQAAHEAIAAAHAVHDVLDVIGARGVDLALIPQHSAPRIVAGGQRAAQRDGDGLQAWHALVEFFAHVGVRVGADLARRHVGIGGFDAKYHFGVFLVANRQIAQADQFGHHFVGFLAPLPQVGAVVQVG